MSDDDLLPIQPYSEAKAARGNPQHQFIEPVKRYKFVSSRGMVEQPNDTPFDMLYDLNEAVRESEAESRKGKSFANVGYSSLKRR